MSLVKNIRNDIKAEWNSLEQYAARETALLHFTDMDTQPWVSKDNHLGYLWTGDLIEAIDAGAIPIDFVKQEIALGHARPSLMYQVENRIEDGLLLPREARKMDWQFVSRYQTLPKHPGAPWSRPGKWLRAFFRHYYRNNRAYRYQGMLHDYFNR
jgi:hypothetical protein